MAERIVLVWLAIGLIAGLLARLALRGRDSGGPAVTVVIGIAGALLAGFFARTLGVEADGIVSCIAAAAGALLLLILYRLMIARRV